MKIYQVGGAVRDRLLGRAIKDRDWVVVGATPAQMEALGYKSVGRDFPVFLHPETHEEYALARTERKTGPGYRGFAFTTGPAITLEEDLARRDVTINAMAMDETGAIIDPYDGQADLKAGILRHVSPAFAEDPLRVLRVARFAARYGYRVAAETLELMRIIAGSGELETLAPERIWQETVRALGERQAPCYFELLRECGALAHIFPEVEQLFGVPQPVEYHPEVDSGVHTLMVLEQACRLSDDPEVRFAALVHDLGKAATPAAELPSHVGHEERGVAIIHALCDRCRIPNRYRDLAVLVARHHLDCHRLGEMKPATILKKLEALDAFRRPGRFEQFLLACEADARGRKGREQRDYPQAEQLRHCFAAARGVDAGVLNESGLQGVELAGALRRGRIAAIAAVRRR